MTPRHIRVGPMGVMGWPYMRPSVQAYTEIEEDISEFQFKYEINRAVGSASRGIGL